jgi:hypothetical protein
MFIPSLKQPRSVWDRVTSWWDRLQQRRHDLADLDRCGPEVERIARESGVSVAELRQMAAQDPATAELLRLRLKLAGIDRSTILRSRPAVMRDLERICTLCGSKRRCERDLARGPDDARWKTYCPNAPTIEALSDRAVAAAQARWPNSPI